MTTKHRQKRHVRYTPDQMFDLVADVERYPHFLPWCTAAKILARRELPDGREELTADLVISFKMVKEKFTSRVVLDRNKRRIDVNYLRGPFRQLDNCWVFHDAGDGTCTIEFYVAFEFRSRMLQMMISAVFSEAVRRMVGAFENRAARVYGAHNRPGTVSA